MMRAGASLYERTPSRLIDVILSPPVHLASAATPGVGLGPPVATGLSSPPQATSSVIAAASARPGRTKRTRGSLLIRDEDLSCSAASFASMLPNARAAELAKTRDNARPAWSHT